MEDLSFKERVEELNFYIKSIKRLDEILNYERDKELNKKFNSLSKNYNASNLVVILKSNACMMMYNLVEATIKSLIANIYTDINLTRLKYNELNEKYRTIIKNYKFNNNSAEKIKESATDLINNILNDEYMIFEVSNFKLSGNADLRKIKEVLERHSIDLNNKQIQKYGSPLVFIKNTRNSLAHGSRTFTTIGSQITISDIEKDTNDIINFLIYLIDQTNDFIASKGYRV
ncbi:MULTISPECIES: MAE_28990/MAE_18760 family HEPN-like nuclease [Lactobacillus]|uniref:MAE_28990/MAE_18760 family HEPN-like nuclease n=1 Tax=Lactobacillus TaxID=1578 RepID=UPI000984C9AC|nr:MULTISPECIES: MAE_28990/MAE_18760 family HEPN-like nuclease [Lactobacillus]OOK87378.1 hypothetical protein B0B48_06330 [Lactobacillus gasseri]VEF35746.1 Uncharacterised protein [Lactobacillus paragasseri]